MRRQLLALGLPLLLSPACHHDFPSAPPGDAGLDRDGPRDLYPGESSPDPDRGPRDLAHPEQPTDVGPKPDQPPPDQMVPDLSVPDQSVSGPCAPGKATLAWQNAAKTLHGCKALSVNQCQAAALCNQQAGYTLCPASTYQQLNAGLSTQPVNQTNYWIAGCAESGGWAMAPTDAICPNACQASTASYKDLAWRCSDQVGVGNAGYKYNGLVSAQDCYKVGINDPAFGSLWFIVPGDYSNASGAVCCK